MESQQIDYKKDQSIQQLQTSFHSEKSGVDNYDENQLFIEELDQLISDRSNYTYLENQSDISINDNDDINNICFYKSQKKQKTNYIQIPFNMDEYPLGNEAQQSQEELQILKASSLKNTNEINNQSKKNLLMQLALFDQEYQNNQIFSLEHDENKHEFMEIIDMKYQKQKQNNQIQKQDPILVIDNEIQNLQQPIKQQINEVNLNTKRSYCETEKENQSPNLIQYYQPINNQFNQEIFSKDKNNFDNKFQFQIPKKSQQYNQSKYFIQHKKQQKITDKSYEKIQKQQIHTNNSSCIQDSIQQLYSQQYQQQLKVSEDQDEYNLKQINQLKEQVLKLELI